jgi:hypothetical protein
MEGMEGLMKNLKLSEAKKRRVRFRGEEGRQGIASPKAFGKLLSEKEARVDVVEQAVRWIWCPMKGIKCKELGDNTSCSLPLETNFQRQLFYMIRQWKSIYTGSWLKPSAL